MEYLRWEPILSKKSGTSLGILIRVELNPTEMLNGNGKLSLNN